ncbi:hypothetical protein OOZ63_20780 [Paucibacter sp. PLA-PC-4]|uniref:hypothetical protein n=1 Tax=Paucibacter sp. PLA-PC-4 TaxID=2993655 RepID=UPI00224B5720|nr:hypothetical protein [Paucibacter sp. PLA-PC-4]MCX2864268.1 hypothetical protein [Paucibacter sp. PLA-PC-4]
MPSNKHSGLGTRLRHRLILWLLLAVFFNAVVGMPVHEAKHLAQSTAPAAQPADDDEHAAEHDEGADGACAWCLAYADLGIALAGSPAVHALAWQAALRRPQEALTFVPCPGRWPFASRDPPAA